MMKTVTMLASASALALVMSMSAASAAEEKKELTPLEQGKELAWNNSKGNCLACHMIAGAEMPGNMGPPLMMMQTRYPDKQKLYDFIYNAPKYRPGTIMPPFGSHKILSKEEIQLITDYIHTL
jgi:sulfur-oxidizing protein SoxX